MKKNLKYLSYIVRHKWFVLMASLEINAPIWQALAHDLSKLFPSEWFPYLEMFYGDKQMKYAGQQAEVDRAFNIAWLDHQHRNKHHWQHWILRNDDGTVKALRMSKKYVLEMVADWMGAGRAITGKWECGEWYAKNRMLMQMHTGTRYDVEKILARYCPGAMAAMIRTECRGFRCPQP